ncbi:MAG: PEP-CTERM sorting domain-containing protein [Planctomycetota bacterium]
MAQGNILVNPGFETGDLTGWDEPVVNNNPWSVLGFARTGSHSAYSAPMPTAGPSNLYQSFDPVPVDQITEAGYWYFHMGGTGSVGSAVTLTFDDATQVQDTLFAADPEYVQFQWAYRDLTPTLSGYTDKSLTQISFFTGVNKAKYIDDVVISVPEPSVLALIGLGTLAMLPRRRASRG